MAIISISDSQVNGADQILVADSNSKIPAKDGSQITILNATNVASGTIASARLDTGTTAGKLVLLDGSGNLPAVDGSLLTGLVGATVSASDPTISTNPSGGVGTEWLNSTSGEMYICTDATAGANVWSNVGAGSDNITPWSYPKSTYGYMYGGNVNAGNELNSIERFSTVSDADSVDWADLIYARGYATSNQRSIDYAYSSGGSDPSTAYAGIDKWPFASQTNATDVGDLTAPGGSNFGCSSESYSYAGKGGGAPRSNIIEKWSHSTDGNSTDVGDAVRVGSRGYSHSSTTHGYMSGGWGGSPAGNVVQIEKFSFSSDGNSADIANLTVGRSGNMSSSSLTHGYATQGYGGTDRIDKTTFASDANATDVGNSRHGSTGGGSSSSLDYGYQSSGGLGDYIDKYSHVTDGNSSNIAGVAVARGESGGTHG